MTRKEKTARENRITKSFNRTSARVCISIWDIAKVFKAGEAAIDAGADDAGLDKAISEFVASLPAQRA